MDYGRNASDPDGKFGARRYVALSVASAMVLEAQQGDAASDFRDDFDSNANIAAAALARLITIYTFDDLLDIHRPVVLDPTLGNFIEGAAMFRPHDRRDPPTGSLWVRQGELASALSFIRKVRLPFASGAQPGRVPPPEAASGKSD